MDPDSLAQLKSQLVRSWQIAPHQNPSELTTPDQFLDALKERIADLLRHDMPTLLTAMYRLDISEKKFEQAMSLSGIDQISDKLAQTVLDREVQRVRSRQSYEKHHKPLDE